MFAAASRSQRHLQAPDHWEICLLSCSSAALPLILYLWFSRARVQFAVQDDFFCISRSSGWPSLRSFSGFLLSFFVFAMFRCRLFVLDTIKFHFSRFIMSRNIKKYQKYNCWNCYKSDVTVTSRCRHTGTVVTSPRCHCKSLKFVMLAWSGCDAGVIRPWCHTVMSQWHHLEIFTLQSWSGRHW